MKTPGTAAFLLAAGALVVPAAAENTWFFEVEYSDPAGVINSVDDTARVTLWAAFDAKLYAFASSELDLAADDPRHAGVWSYLTRILKGPGTRDGTAVDGTVHDIAVGQLHFPSAGIFADTSNPIAAWTALWQTEDLRPRSIPLSTATATLNIYTNPDGTSKDFIDTIVEGAGVITVVPAPSAVPIVAMGLVRARRRR